MVQIEFAGFVGQAKADLLAIGATVGIDGEIPAIGAVVEGEALAKNLRSILPVNFTRSALLNEMDRLIDAAHSRSPSLLGTRPGRDSGLLGSHAEHQARSDHRD